MLKITSKCTGPTQNRVFNYQFQFNKKNLYVSEFTYQYSRSYNPPTCPVIMTHEAGHVVITFFCRQIYYVAFTRIDGLVLTRTLTQTFMIWSPFLLPKVPFWSPSHSKLGPLLVPILKNLGPLSMWGQCKSSGIQDFGDVKEATVAYEESSGVRLILVTH